MVRFGPFEVSMETGELRKHGVRVRLQRRPFQILAALLERPGRLVTREELRTRLWPADVFVDFESGLNTAVNRLRLALGDCADDPTYIETLARLGYRFLAPVEIVLPRPEQVVMAPKSAPSNVPPVPEVVAGTPEPHVRVGRRRWLWGGTALACVGIAVAASLFIRETRHRVLFQQLTFRKGFITNARFAPDGKHIAYSAEWNGAPSRVYLISMDGRESRDLNRPDTWLEAASNAPGSGILVQQMNGETEQLARVSLNGTPAQVLAEKVRRADSGPDGKLCLVTARGSTYTIEYPAGHVLYRTAAWIGDVRVSRDGRRVAFTEHPVLHDDGGQVAVVDAANGSKRVLSAGWASVVGIAWSASGTEVWFTAARSGVERSLMAVTLDGRTRVVAQTAGGMHLRDIARSGEVVVERTNNHMLMSSGDLSEGSQQDISWLDWSRPVGVSADGNTILFDESGTGGGSGYSVFVYTRGSQLPKRIGSGRAMDLSEDGQWALAQDAGDPSKLSLLSIANQTAQPIRGQGFIYYWSKFLPQGQEILAGGHFPGQPAGIYRQHIPDRDPVLLTSGVELDEPVIDRTGQFAAGVSDKCEITIIDLKTGTHRAVRSASATYPVVFMDENHALTRTVSNKTITLDSLDLRSGQSSLFRKIQPSDVSGLSAIFPMHIARNLKNYVYSRLETYSDLFLVTGLT
jgi:eukaryotic-like serine/threonine-protein kinase